MALSDLAVFSEHVYSTATEILRQRLVAFNAASRGGLQLTTDPISGDYRDTAFWQKIDGLVRRRNPYGSSSVNSKELHHIIDTMVKVAAGTPPIRRDNAWLSWLKRNPEEAGVVIGQQLAVDTLADMLNTALIAATAALAGESEVNYDGTSGLFAIETFNEGQAKMGDAYQDIVVWVMHSKPLFNIYGAAINNGEGLFTFGSINVRQDGFGRSFVITDSPSLVIPPDGGNPAYYRSLGLTAGGVIVAGNNDFHDNLDERNGFENITLTYQAEWSYNLGVKGFAWDKTSGGAAPNDAALATSANWDRYATSHKDLAGVLITTQ